MKKLIIFIFTLALALGFIVSAVSAATLTLDTIGTYEVPGGKPSGKIFYTDHFPTFVGKAAANATVTVSIAGLEDGVATASAAGTYSYKPTKEMTKGDYNITIASGGETLSFQLGIETGLPVSGFDLQAVIIFGSLFLAVSIMGVAYRKGLLKLHA